MRDYPHGALGSHLFGYVGAITEEEYERCKHEGYSPNDVIGKDGLEYAYDRYLRGEPGGQRVVVDATGAVVSTYRRRPPFRATRWSRTSTGGCSRSSKTRSRTGIASLGPRPPALRRRGRRGSVDRRHPRARELSQLRPATTLPATTFETHSPLPHRVRREPLFDRAIAAATPTGSTFKMVTGSAALTEGVVKVDQVVYDTGGWNCGGYYARDIAAGGLGNTTFVPALAASSDGYFFRLSWWLGNASAAQIRARVRPQREERHRLAGRKRGQLADQRVGDARFRRTDGTRATRASWESDRARCKPRRYRWPTSRPPSSTAGRSIPRRSCAKFALATAAIVKTFSPHVIREVPVTPQALAAVRAGMARVTDPGGTAYGLAIAGSDSFRGRPARPKRPAETGRTRPGSSRGRRAIIQPSRMAVFVDRSGGYGAQVAAPIARQILVRYFKKKG